MHDRIMNVHEAAEYMGCSVQSIRRMVQAEILPRRYDGRAFIFVESELKQVKNDKYPRGMCHSDIAREYKVSRQTVVRQFQRLQVKPIGINRGKNRSKSYNPSTVAKFARLLGWDHRGKSQRDAE